MFRFRRHLPLTALLLLACEHDPLPAAGGGGSDAFVAGRYVGEWRGTWTNTTLNTSGPATLVVDASGGLLTGTIDLGGDPFGGGDPAAQTLVATIGSSAATLTTQNSVVFGQISGRLDADGTVTASLIDVPPGLLRDVMVVGEWLDTSLDLEATLTYAAGMSPDIARAVLRLSRQ